MINLHIESTVPVYELLYEDTRDFGISIIAKGTPVLQFLLLDESSQAVDASSTYTTVVLAVYDSVGAVIDAAISGTPNADGTIDFTIPSSFVSAVSSGVYKYELQGDNTGVTHTLAKGAFRVMKPR